MDNYLSHRWPQGPEEVKPARTGGEPNKPKKKKSGVGRTVLILLVAAVLVCAMLTAAVFGVQYAADKLANGGPTAEDSGTTDSTGGSQRPTFPLPGPKDEWTADMLPWTDPDPSVQIQLISGEGKRVYNANEIYKKLLPSIVCVQASEAEGFSVGSGIIISESGFIITNYHIVEGGADLSVMLLSDESVHDAWMVGYDEELDLAVIKIEGTGYTPAVMGISDELEEGDPVYAIGNPMGYLYGTITEGIVANVDEERFAGLDYEGRLILTSAALNSGNSGGALVDSHGHVVGITSAKITGIDGDVVTEGLGLAIPMSDVTVYLNRILRTGESSRPAVGISCYSVTLDDGRPGLYVAEVTKGTPAEGKLRAGDVVLSTNGVPATSVDDLIRVIAVLDPGDEVELGVLRGDKELTITIELYDRLEQ